MSYTTFDVFLGDIEVFLRGRVVNMFLGEVLHLDLFTMCFFVCLIATYNCFYKFPLKSDSSLQISYALIY